MNLFIIFLKKFTIMGKEIDLSILVPAYNNTESLIRALDSIKDQTIAKKISCFYF